MTHELSPSGMPNPAVRLPSAGPDLRRAARPVEVSRAPEEQEMESSV